jgi:hypothetical protein
MLSTQPAVHNHPSDLSFLLCHSVKEYKPIEAKLGAGLTPLDLAHMLRPMSSDAERVHWMTQVAGIPGIVQKQSMLPACRKYEIQVQRLLEEIKAGEQVPKPRSWMTWLASLFSFNLV